MELREGDPVASSLSLVAGLALAEAVDLAMPGQPLMLKWPNDLMLAGAKVAGILLERQNDRVVAGFGVNLASAPDVAERRVGDFGGAIRPEAFAPILAGTMDRMVALWRSSTPALFAQAWLARAHAIGTPLAAHGEDGKRVSGTFDGIEADGSLRLQLGNGEMIVVRAGDVTLG